MILAHLLYGISFESDITPVALLLVMFLGEAAYTISLAPIAWLIMSEIFPNRIRARGMMVATLALQMIGFLVNWMFPAIQKGFTENFNLEGGIFFMFSFICFLAFIFIWNLVPETKGKSLEEISRFWSPADTNDSSESPSNKN